MCIRLWRRYFCPKAPNFQPLEPGRHNKGPYDHPRPNTAVPNHHLQLEDLNFYRENAEDPSAEVPKGKHIHWIKNWIRCAHVHQDHCFRHLCTKEEIWPKKILYIEGACPYCTGDIDMHVEDQEDVKAEFDVHTRIPVIPIGNGRDRRLLHHLDSYKDRYLGQLLKLLLCVLMKPLLELNNNCEWVQALHTAWPEVWCKLKRNHIGHEDRECKKDECHHYEKEWRVNLAFAIRKNEAEAILKHVHSMNGGHMGFVEFNEPRDAASPPFRPRPNEAMYERFQANEYPKNQMEYVKLSDELYTRRLNRLLGLSVACRRALELRGQRVSQAEPARRFFKTRRIEWMDWEVWTRSLDRRKCFLDWVYQFLARDAGLDEEVMMYFGGPLLAILNLWPSHEFQNHPSHPEPQAFEPHSAAWDILEECVYWLEYHWPLNGTDGTDRSVKSLKLSVSHTEQLLSIIRRNRELEEQDMALRNRSAEVRTSMFKVSAEKAIAEGSTTCVICQHGWNNLPFHEPVKMPCCGSYIGRRCLKQYLAKQKIPGRRWRRERDDTPEPVPSAPDWNCMLCRGKIG
ncbi:hypothetical protein CPLU01_00552 [Colletotrichum plurivorum]|uniref:RING-type domain-containing protein n=1 Tax=Colletotrichum plurivorum TaxID=2175906 RepID=A0A8H6U5W1_9PEZI|nr:hypothetical protein CPLU01_00552 [Colletotrichum plurivorum]